MDDEAYGSVEFRGQTNRERIFIMESIIQCNPISEEQILAIALEWEAALER